MKKIWKGLFLLIILFYLLLYFSYKNGYYVKRNEEMTHLTEEKIKEYENDLANGVDVSKKSYVVTRESFDNKYTRLSLKVSHAIESIIDKSIKHFFRKISDSINE